MNFKYSNYYLCKRDLVNMKVYIAFDMEGCTGTSISAQMGPKSEIPSAYPRAQRMATDDVKAAIESEGFKAVEIIKSAFAGKATSLFPYSVDIEMDWWGDEENIKGHVYFFTKVAGIPIYVDASADQFVFKDRRCQDLGILVVPLERLDADSWPYMGGFLHMGNKEQGKIRRMLGKRSDLFEFDIKERSRLFKLRAKPRPKISPSILAVKVLSSAREIIEQCILAIRAGADMIHIDVLGGKGVKTAVVEAGSDDTSAIFTPALLAGIKKTAALEKLAIPVDVHIMDMEPSEACIESWINSGADYIALHWEAYLNKNVLKERLLFIQGRGVKAGIALRPDVNIKEIIEFLKENPKLVNLVSQAGVYPCLGGQTMAYDILQNVNQLKEAKTKHKFIYKIMVDGGIEPEVSARKCAWAGADILVAGSAFFGSGRRNLKTMQVAARALKDISPLEELDIYDVIARRILDIRRKKTGKVWVRIEAYHAGGKSYATRIIEERLRSLDSDIHPVAVGLDLSWTDRRKRSQWADEAKEARAKRQDHPYFHSLTQEPEPTHWRKAHSDSIISTFERHREGEVRIENCYQFNEVGDTNGVRIFFPVTEDSILLVEGVYASALDKQDWDLRIYLKSDREISKRRAMLRDEQKVHRPQEQTRALYEDVYENSYTEYEDRYRPVDNADILIDVDGQGVDSNMLPLNPKIIRANPLLILLECTNPDCRRQAQPVRINACRICGKDPANIIAGDVDFLNSIDEEDPTMWRYRRLMPVDPRFIVRGGEGNTPVVYMPLLSKMLGVHLWFKLEITNPTGTFKDREASYVVSVSRQHGQKNIVMQSTGNTAIAITHYASLAGMPSWAFIPTSSIYKLLMPSKRRINRIIAVNGDPIDVKRVAEDFACRFGFPKISPFYERCEANATQGYEIVEKILRGELPAQDILQGDSSFDFYVQTIAAGMGPIGYYIAMKRLQKWTNGKIRVPRIVAAEITEFSPIQSAWDLDLD